MTVRRSINAALIAVILAACGGGGGGGSTDPEVGSLQVAVTGLPAGPSASILVSGPDDYSRSLTGSTTISNLDPGAYTVAASNVQVSANTYAATPLNQTVQVTAGDATLANVSYTVVPGTLTITVTGLPAGTAATVTVTGPGGYNSNVTASTVLAGLTPGTYTIAATGVNASGTTFTPAPASQNRTVSSTTPAAATVTYQPPAGALNLSVGAWYITQSVQNTLRGAPLLEGRAGLLRVFVVASTTNTAAPDVRVRFYQGGVLVQTTTIPAPGASVPVLVDEDPLTTSWNLPLGSTLMEAGLEIIIDVDPDNLIAEFDEADNSVSSGGAPLNLGVGVLPAFNIRFVPVTQSGLTGNITAGNVAQFLDLTTRIHPLAIPVNTAVRSTYVFGFTLQANDQNGAWTMLLNEIDALRVAEDPSWYYFGIAATSYNSGIAGYGFVPGKTAVGWDKLPSASEVVAHELGHNFSRFHSPSGEPDGIDPNYPFLDGTIGNYGYDVFDGTLMPPTMNDVMGYCNNNWIGIYNYAGAYYHRSTSGSVVQSGRGREPSLIVWGRIENGQAVLEPAFESTTLSSLPRTGGRFILHGLDARGAEAFRIGFAPQVVADARVPAEQFAFAVPLRLIRGRQVDRLLLSGPGIRVERASTGAAGRATAPGLTLERRAGRATVGWDPGAYPLAVIRDAATGQIRSLARGGSIELPDAAGFEVTLSDGTRSVVSRVR